MRDGGQADARHDAVPISESSRGTSGKSVYAAEVAKRAYSAAARPAGSAPPAEAGSSGVSVASMTAPHHSRVGVPSAAPKLGCAALCALYAARKLRARPASSPSSASPKRAASSRYCAAMGVRGAKSVP